jgi:hypothetical protein
MSVVTALKSQRPTDLGDLIDQLEGLTRSYQKVVIQWVPAHCDIQGNERADKLAKKGGALQQEDTRLTYEVAKSYIKCHLSSKWEKSTHPTNKAMHSTNCLCMPRLRLSDFVQDTIGYGTTCTTSSKCTCVHVAPHL